MSSRRRGWPFGRGRRAPGPLGLNLDDYGSLDGLEPANDGPRHETLGEELRAARLDLVARLRDVVLDIADISEIAAET